MFFRQRIHGVFLCIGGNYASVITVVVIFVVVQLELCRDFDLLDSVVLSTASDLEKAYAGLSVTGEIGINVKRGRHNKSNLVTGSKPMSRRKFTIEKH